MSANLIEDIYTLSPTQRGMLYHVLAESAAHAETGVYFEQAIFTLQGAFDTTAFARAWQMVINRHASLRTAFAWKGISKPVQMVYRQVEAELREFDWRGESLLEQEQRLANFLLEDRQRGFDLGRPPLMRLTLIRTDEETCQAVWSSHHLVLDAWSNTILSQEAFAYYEAFRTGRDFAPAVAPRYRDYVAWLKRQDMSEAQAFWQSTLAGFTDPTPLPKDRTGSDQQTGYGQRQIRLTPQTTAALSSYARKRQLTLNVLLEAAWALLLSYHSRRSGVVFGLVVSGRPAALAGADATVGLFINTLPMRIQVNHADRLENWLSHIQARQTRMCEYQHTPLSNIQGWSEVPKGQALFESIIVFLNMGDLRLLRTGNVRLLDFRAVGYSNYPLTLRATPGDQLLIEALYHQRDFSAGRIDSLLEQLTLILNHMTQQPEASVGDLIVHLEDSEGKRRETALNARRQSAASKLLRTQPQRINLSAASSIETGYINENKLPLIISPSHSDLDLAAWAGDHRQLIEQRLREHSGILFRGFHIGSLGEFERLLKTLFPNLLDYLERSTPRTQLRGKIYTSTEYPAHQQIALHNEFSYALTWPMKIAFHCVHPAETGGETPIADSRRVFQLLTPRTREQFINRQVMYVRNYGSGIDLTWQEAFQTSERAGVEEHCRHARVEVEWRDHGGLRTRQIREATATHPLTGEELWFNQAHLFHVSNLEPAVRASMLNAFAEPDLPRNAYYGDGAPIENATLDEVRAAYDRATICFPWQKGDLLLLDNMLVAHGRRPYSGKRNVAVAMAEAFNRPDHT